jgi:uncharacterized protein
MWEIYDELIAAIPPKLEVSDCLVGLHWTLIRSRGLGIALTPFERSHSGPKGASVIAGISKQIAGMSVCKLAEYVKSWDPFEATLGLAAINSVFNSPELVERIYRQPLSNQGNVSAFVHYADMVRGKRVAVVGHFPDLDTLSPVCELTILERNPGDGDLPDPACEYVLPSQDFVFITATTLINKTLPRLLDLSGKASVFLVGPSTPFAPLLFNHGIDTLAGTVVVDAQSVWRAAQEGGARIIFDHGAQMVKVSRQDWEGKRRGKKAKG